ncbi:response regulator [Pelomonas sp. SE-A7]|uniref:response regulator n=1 Tax=Pelomonas sp. SE-A7 TaxID=3054953 RepID=UPI00259C7281|nr:response regulator [Pelomonas sp. SE-A7]MDM4765961.1 response regulator [Pelomonas sp. SE-A7]
MRILDDGIQQASALIIDANANSRSLLAAQLRDLGVGNVRQTTRLRDARVMLENKAYDIVLCDYHFEGSEQSGQHLLDELRREQLLPYSTVFVMVTGEATYAVVAEAAEAALDAYLIKPYTTASLAERLANARYRKRVLKDIFEAIESESFDLAADLCMKRFEARAPFWLYAARIGAELLLRLDRHTDARKLYDSIIEAKTMPWARLGVARTEIAAGNLNAARRTLEVLIGDMPDHADSYDMMGRVQMEQGEIEAALGTYRTAAGLTPGCILRTQRCATLAFYAGEREEAIKLFERTMANGLKSKLFDALGLTLLGLARFDRKDGKGLAYVHDCLQQLMERDDSERLRRFEQVFRILKALYGRQLAEALALTRDLSRQSEQPEFDLEAAHLLVGVLVRLASQDIQLEEMDATITRLGLRYCVSKSSTELMVAMTEGNDAAAAELRNCHARIFGIAETAMRYSMRHEPRMGVTLLIEQGEQTRNAKLIDMASLVLQRHADKVEDGNELARQIDDLQAEWVRPQGTALSRNQRAVGGLALRTRKAA